MILLLTRLALAASGEGRDEIPCMDMPAVESAAMIGTLSPDVTACLEARFKSGTPSQRDQASRVLIANAYARGDEVNGARLLLRHLTEVDESDPDLDFKYALQEQEVGADAAALHWATVAYRYRDVWTGDTYQKRVRRLLRVRAESAVALWARAVERDAAASTDETQRDVKLWHDHAVRASREWLTVLASAGEDVAPATQACERVAGDPAECVALQGLQHGR